MEIITIAAAKGGVGKTTTAAALTQAAILKGRKALLLDIDPQRNASYAIAAPMTGSNTFELITGKRTAAECIQRSPQGCDVIPASKDLETLTTAPGSARRLAAALEPIKGNYDVIIIDTPTAGHEPLFNALQASTKLIIPQLPDIFALQSVFQLVDTAREFQQTNKELQISGLLINQYESRTNNSKGLLPQIRSTAEALGVPLLGFVRSSTALKDAQTWQESIYDSAPKCNPAQDFLRVFEALNI